MAETRGALRHANPSRRRHGSRASPRTSRTGSDLPILAVVAAVLAMASCATGHLAPVDGSGHRALAEAPGEMSRGRCPEYRENHPGQTYYWDVLAFRTELEAELAICSRVVPDTLGGWVVEERSDEDGSYSIAAYLSAATHSVAYDWGDFQPALWLTCWQTAGGPEGGHEGGDTPGTNSEGGSLEAALWYFGPPQFRYGEPTPIEYRFEGESSGQQQLWWGHPGQAEVALLLKPDSYRLAVEMRRAADQFDGERSGPMLTVQTWDGESLSRLGASQGEIEFDLLGLERAAFPVFDACEASRAPA